MTYDVWLLWAAGVLVMLLWGLGAITSGSAALALGGTTKRLGILAIASLTGLLVQLGFYVYTVTFNNPLVASPNTVEAILHPFGPGTFLALFVLAALGAAFLTEQIRSILRWVVMIAVSVAGLLVIYQFVGLTKLIDTNAGLMTMFIVALPMLVGEAHHRKKSRHDTHMIVAVVMIGATLGGLFLTAYQILPTWSQTTLPYWANWQILLESYKNWKHLFVGVGAENFLSAFTAGRPAALNMTPLWNTRFTLGSSLAFHIATVYGMVGAAAFGWFLTNVHPVAILALLFLPPSFPALIVVAALLIFSEPASRLSFARGGLAKLIAIAVLLVVGAISYGLYRAYSAELAFARSLSALEARDGTKAYNLQIEAITKNPRITRFHTAYSQTNLALANAIAENSATGSADRETATQLVQQAIREAKIGVNLSPANILAWENIANVYQTLTGVAQGADQWTVAAFSKAMQLDPTNPVIRLRLGGAYVGQQKFDQAAESYAAAVALKSDYANAYYNLAFVYREQKKYLTAAQAIKESLKYVTNPDDVSRAHAELTELTELLTEEEKLSLGQLP